MSRKGFQDKVLPLKHKLFRFALSMVGDRAEAEDVVQEVLIKVWQRWAELENIENLEAWVVRATRNKSIDHLRSKHRRTQDLDSVYHLENGQPDPEQLASSGDTIARVKDLMADLPEKQRLVMHLRDMEGYSYQEIENALEMPMSQVKINLYRARQKIREAIVQTTNYGTTQH